MKHTLLLIVVVILVILGVGVLIGGKFNFSAGPEAEGERAVLEARASVLESSAQQNALNAEQERQHREEIHEGTVGTIIERNNAINASLRWAMVVGIPIGVIGLIIILLITLSIQGFVVLPIRSILRPKVVSSPSRETDVIMVPGFSIVQDNRTGTHLVFPWFRPGPQQFLTPPSVAVQRAHSRALEAAAVKTQKFAAAAFIRGLLSLPESDTVIEEDG